MPTRTESIRCIARQELRATLQGRMVPAFALLFALLAVGIALAGLAGTGRILVQDFTRTAVSLLTLSLYLLPLLGLVIGAAAFGGEDGGTELLLSQPIGRGEVLAGRALGVAAALGIVAGAGFGAAGLLVGGLAGADGLAGYLLVACSATGVGIVGVGLGVLIGTLARRRAAAVGWALAVWFTAAVLYDLVAIGMLQTVGGGQVGPLLVAILALNPIDGVRALGLVGLGADVLLGPTGAALQRELGGLGTLWVLGSVAAWLTVPLAAAGLVYRRRDF